MSDDNERTWRMSKITEAVGLELLHRDPVVAAVARDALLRAPILKLEAIL